MKAALFSDIHANHPALCAALARAESLGCTRFLAAGDLVGGGPHPAEVVRLLADMKAACVLGNVDRKVLRQGTDPEAAGKALESPKKANWKWTWDVLGESERRWLAGLPRDVRLTEGPATMRIFHGSPASDEEYLFPSLTPEAFARWRGGDESRVWVFGHSHIPFSRVMKGTRLVNCGSVGRPVDGDPRGSFAVIDLEAPPPYPVTLIRFDFDLNRLIADLRSRTVPGALPEEYARGVKIKGA